MPQYLSRKFICAQRRRLRIGTYECGNEVTKIVERKQHDVVLEKHYMCDACAEEWMKGTR